MYMPTVARFTSRDPLPQAGDPVLLGTAYWYANNSPTLLIDPSGLLTIKRLEAELKVKCGENAYVQWDFILPKKSWQFCGTLEAGYFVQKIEVWCRRIPCPPCAECPTIPQDLGKPAITFYEAWEVGWNDTMAKIRAGAKPKFTYTDQSNFPPPNNECGYFIAKGEVRFICANDADKGKKAIGGVGEGGRWKINQPDYLGGDDNCTAGSASVPSTRDENDVKTFWEKHKDVPAFRELRCQYKCCGSDDVNCTAKP